MPALRHDTMVCAGGKENGKNVFVADFTAIGEDSIPLGEGRFFPLQFENLR
jgi:hypothetical protein